MAGIFDSDRFLAKIASTEWLLNDIFNCNECKITDIFQNDSFRHMIKITDIQVKLYLHSGMGQVSFCQEALK